MNNPGWNSNALGYSTVETLLEEVSNHMASSNLSRYPRGPTGPTGPKTCGSMRIAKPSSSNGSPRNSIGLGRRRTVMTDGTYRRRLATMMDQNALASGNLIANDGPPIQSQITRPVSWHPASHMQNTTPYQQAYIHPAPQTNNQYQNYNFPPTPTAYSGYTSPASTFSPLSGPFNGHEQPYTPQDPSMIYVPNPDQGINYVPLAEQQTEFYSTPTTANMDPTMYSHFDWSNFAANGFDDAATAPPTPENFLPIQHPEPSFPAEDSIPYEPLDDSEEAGEELIGMGLYDTPEAAKSPSSDPHLDNYRTLMMSHLLGPAYRRPESVGKGLKLEETWNPPTSDDGEDDSDQDGEGEDDDPTVERVETPVEVVNNGNFVQAQFHTNIGIPNYGQGGWL